MGAHQIVHLCAWIALFCGGPFFKTGAISGPLENAFGSEDQVTSLESTFITAFLQNGDSTEIPQRELLVTGTSPITTVSITVTKSNFSKVVTVGKGETVIIPITISSELKGTETSQQTVVITADADVTVMSRNYRNNRGDVSLINPVHQLGQKYYIITPQKGPESQYKEFLVVSYKNKTTVDIYLKGSVNFNGKKYFKGQKMTVILESFQAIQIQSKDDLSGTKVISSQPVAVIAGHTCAESNIGCSHVYEQLKPVESWGSSFFIPGLSFQPNYDNVLIMASENTSIQYKSGKETVKRDVGAGELLQIQVSQFSPMSIQSSSGIQVLVNGNNGTINNMCFATSLTLVLDIDAFARIFDMIIEMFDTNLDVIITKTSSVPGITIDGKSPVDIEWKTIPGSEYSWAEYNLGSGISSHTVQHPTDPFAVLINGYSRKKAYGTIVSGGILSKTGAISGPLENAFGSEDQDTSLESMFITAFLQNGDSTETPQRELLVTGTSPKTTISITVCKSNFNKVVTVGKGETVIIPITLSTELKGTETSPQTVVITADADVSVMSRNYRNNSGDVSLIYPVHELGNEYHIITPQKGPENQYKEFLVVSCEEQTPVDIYLKGSVTFNGKKYFKGQKMTVILEPFQVIQIQSKDDLSGTKVISSHPVAVIAGHTCAESNIGCSHVYEQLRPVESWGTSFFIPGLSFQPNYDNVLIMASENTSIQYKSGKETMKRDVGAGELLQIQVSQFSPMSIQSSSGIQVLVNGNNGTINNMCFATSLTLVLDIDAFGRVFDMIIEMFDTNLDVIITKTSSVPGITIDGKSPIDIEWKTIPGSEYSWAEYNLGSGISSHTVQHPTDPFALFIIGYSRKMAYGTIVPDDDKELPSVNVLQ